MQIIIECMNIIDFDLHLMPKGLNVWSKKGLAYLTGGGADAAL